MFRDVELNKSLVSTADRSPDCALCKNFLCDLFARPSTGHVFFCCCRYGHELESKS